MVSSLPSVLLLGHPFIRRLRDDLRLRFHSGAEVTFGLSDDAIVHLHGFDRRPYCSEICTAISELLPLCPPKLLFWK